MESDSQNRKRPDYNLNTIGACGWIKVSFGTRHYISILVEWSTTWITNKNYLGLSLWWKLTEAMSQVYLASFIYVGAPVLGGEGLNSTSQCIKYIFKSSQLIL